MAFIHRFKVDGQERCGERHAQLPRLAIARARSGTTTGSRSWFIAHSATASVTVSRGSALARSKSGVTGRLRPRPIGKPLAASSPGTRRGSWPRLADPHKPPAFGRGVFAFRPAAGALLPRLSYIWRAPPPAAGRNRTAPRRVAGALPAHMP